MKIFKKAIALLLAVFAVSATALCVSAEEDGAAVEAPAIVILHTNDVHSRVDTYLGYESVAGWKEYYESLGAAVFVVDAGDALHGLPIANLKSGMNIVKIMNAVGYDAMTPGNHDFNYGADRLFELSKYMDFSLISCNLRKDDGTLPLEPYTIREKNGLKVAFIGVCTPETVTKTDAKNTAGYGFDPDTLAADIQTAVDAARDGGADYIVALGHLGIDSQSEPWRSADIIPQLTGIDAFIDGHSHSDVAETVKDKDGKDVILTQTGCYIENIGCVTVSADGVIKATKLTEKKENADVAELIKAMQDELAPLMDKVVAHTSVVLNGERAPGVRTEETNLGDLSADALIAVSGADVAIVNGGGIRVTLPEGNITVGELNSVFPFGNIVNTIEVTGSDLIAALENGCKDCPGASGGFPQVAGMTFEIHAYAKQGERIRNLRIGGVEADPDAVYTLVSNDYTIGGGDGYDMLASYPLSGAYGALDEALVTYISDSLNGTVGDEYALPQGRIAVYNSVEDVPTPETGDGATAVFALITLLSLAGAAYAAKKR